MSEEREGTTAKESAAETSDGAPESPPAVDGAKADAPPAEAKPSEAEADAKPAAKEEATADAGAEPPPSAPVDSQPVTQPAPEPVPAAEGAKAEGEGAKGDGEGAKGDGEGEKAEGEGASADGEGAKADGEGEKAEGEGAKAEGEGAKADGEGEKAEGEGEKSEPAEPALVPVPEPLRIEAVEEFSDVSESEEASPQAKWRPHTRPASAETMMRVVLADPPSLEGAVLTVGGQTIEASVEGSALHFTLPALPAGHSDVKIELPDGRSGVRVAAIHAAGPPRLERLEPFVVGAGGGATVILHGKELRKGGVVLFAGREIHPELIFDGARFKTSAAPVGMAAIGFRNADGQTSNTISIEVREGPVVTAAEPKVLPLGGGAVTLQGRGFEAGLTVSVGGVPASVTSVADHEVVVDAPRCAAGDHGVHLVNPDGLFSKDAVSLTYEHRPLEVSSVSPIGGWVTGGTRITIEGKNLVGTQIVRFGAKDAEILQVEAARVIVLAPTIDEAGKVTVHVARHDGETLDLPGAYDYEHVPAPPKILSIDPAKGYTTGGQTVKIQGDNFDAGTRIRFGGEPCVAKVLGRTLLEVTTPTREQAGVVDVEAVQGDVVVTVAAAFTYEARPKPVITGVTPAKGPVMGGTKVTVEGEHFFPEYWIRVGRERPTNVPSRNATTIVLLTPPRPQVGTVDVEMGVGETVLAVKKACFQYEGIPAPTFEGLAPKAGGPAGGTEVTIEGKNFVKETQVLFGGKPATKVKFVDAKTLEVKTPPGENGKMVDVAVKNPDGKEAVMKRAFQYDARYG